MGFSGSAAREVELVERGCDRPEAPGLGASYRGSRSPGSSECRTHPAFNAVRARLIMIHQTRDHIRVRILDSALAPNGSADRNVSDHARMRDRDVCGCGCVHELAVAFLGGYGCGLPCTVIFEVGANMTKGLTGTFGASSACGLEQAGPSTVLCLDPRSGGSWAFPSFRGVKVEDREWIGCALRIRMSSNVTFGGLGRHGGREAEIRRC